MRVRQRGGGAATDVAATASTVGVRANIGIGGLSELAACRLTLDSLLCIVPHSIKTKSIYSFQKVLSIEVLWKTVQDIHFRCGLSKQLHVELWTVALHDLWPAQAEVTLVPNIFF